MLRTMAWLMASIVVVQSGAINMRVAHDRRTTMARPCAGSMRLCTSSMSAEPDPDIEQQELMASFKDQLDSMGGAKNVKLRSDAKRAASSITESVQDVSKGLMNAGTERSKSDGLLDPGSWRLTVGFFGILIALSVTNAILNPPPDPTSLNYVPRYSSSSTMTR